jgi:hypothetical protein
MRLSTIPKEFAQFKSTAKEYISSGGRHVRLRFKSPGMSMQFVYPHEMRYPTTLACLAKSWHPIKIMLQRRWDEMSTNKLWVFYNIQPIGSGKAVVKRVHCKRMRKALTAALGTKGYDSEGMSVVSSRPPLKGSLMIRGDTELLKTSDEDLVKAFTHVVASIEKKGERV